MPKSYEEATCLECGQAFQQLTVRVLGHEVYRAKVCQDCLPKDEPEEMNAKNNEP